MTDNLGHFFFDFVKENRTFYLYILIALEVLIMRISKRAIFAADDEFDENNDFGGRDDFEDDFMSEDDSIEDSLDDLADNVEDMQESMDDVTEDDPNIENENNIENHYIAECDRCKGIFISAVVESDQEIEKISGTCPLCEKESDQYLKWVVKPVE